MTFDYLRLRADALYRQELIDWAEEDDGMRDLGREVCRTNLLALCYVLGYTRIDPEIHREALAFYPPRDLAKPVDRQAEGQLKTGTLLYPRGAYKTTISEADSVQEIICFPTDSADGFLCANANLAEAIVQNIGAHFIRPKDAHPTLFQALFPELCTPDRRAAEGGRFSPPTRRLQPPIKESAVMGFSVESGVSGWHFHRLKCDDMANNRNMKSENSQAEVYRNYRINRKMLNPGGIEHKIGTRYGPFDPYGLEIASSRPGSYRYVVKPALRLRNGERLDANGFPPKDEMELLFEKIGLTYEVLRDEYESDYSSFMTQYMNDAYGANEVTFSHDLMMSLFRPEAQLPVDGRITIRWRLPNRTLNWNAAAAVVGMTDGLRMIVTDGVHGTYKPSLLAIKIVTLAKKYDIHQVTIEDSPGARNLEPAIRNYALTLGYPVHLQWAEFKADQAERDLRIRTLETVMVSGRLLFSDGLPVVKKLLEQFTNYGISAENAFPDLVSRLAEQLPPSIARVESNDDGLARELLAERDHWNQIYGHGAYAEREPEPAPDETFFDSEPANPWGYDDIMPGLNA